MDDKKTIPRWFVHWTSLPTTQFIPLLMLRLFSVFSNTSLNKSGYLSLIYTYYIGVCRGNYVLWIVLHPQVEKESVRLESKLFLQQVPSYFTFIGLMSHFLV